MAPAVGGNNLSASPVVTETEEAITVVTMLLGVDPSDIEARLAGDVLTIGTKPSLSKAVEKAAIMGKAAPAMNPAFAFVHTFWLPPVVDKGRIEAVVENGVLTLVLPKRGNPELTVDDPLFGELLASTPGLRERWKEHAPARELALILVGMRRKAGLSQKELAEVAGWDQGYVSRLESGRAPIPDLATVQRYAKACGGEAGYVLVDDEGAASVVRPYRRNSARSPRG